MKTPCWHLSLLALVSSCQGPPACRTRSNVISGFYSAGSSLCSRGQLKGKKRFLYRSGVMGILPALSQKKGREVDIGQRWRSVWSLASSGDLVTGGNGGGSHRRPPWKRQEGAEYEKDH